MESDGINLADELAKLESLRQSGVLSEAEFAQAKARVLGAAPAGAAPAARTWDDDDREPMPGSFLHKLERSRTDAWIGGVCGGLGRSTAVPSWAWRLMYTLALCFGGLGILPYVLMWIFIPLEPGDEA